MASGVERLDERELAYLRAAQANMHRASKALVEAQGTLVFLSSCVAQEHNLTPQDMINLDDGTIRRAAPPPSQEN